jgi:hypothetical protein
MPKLIFRKNHPIPIYFHVLQKETINKFTHRFAKFMQSNKQYVSVDLKGNKLVEKSVIEMLLRFGKKLIR